MIQIELTTHISAPLERCFHLCRSIDLHMASTNWTGEKAVAGVTSGLIGADQRRGHGKAATSACGSATPAELPLLTRLISSRTRWFVEHSSASVTITTSRRKAATAP